MSNNTPTHQRPSIRCDTKRSIDAEIAVTRFPLSGERIEHGYFYIYIYIHIDGPRASKRYRPPPRFLDRSARFVFSRARASRRFDARFERSINRAPFKHYPCTSQPFSPPSKGEISRSTFPRPISISPHWNEVDFAAVEIDRVRSKLPAPPNPNSRAKQNTDEKHTCVKSSLSLRFIFIGLSIYFCLPSFIPTTFLNGLLGRGRTAHAVDNAVVASPQRRVEG